jgi:hypothetical protein
MPGQLGQDSKSLGPSVLYKQTFLWIAGEIPILTLYLFEQKNNLCEVALSARVNPYLKLVAGINRDAHCEVIWAFSLS